MMLSLMVHINRDTLLLLAPNLRDEQSHLRSVFDLEQPPEPTAPTVGAGMSEGMEQRLATTAGKQKCKLRQQTVEPVLGIIKMCPSEKRRNRSRIVSSLGKRSKPAGSARRDWHAAVRSGRRVRPNHHRHQKNRERMRQRDGVVGRWFGKRQRLLRFAGEPDLSLERNQTDRPAKGQDRLGRFTKNQLGFPKKGGHFRAGRVVQGRRWFFKHQSPCNQPFPQSDLFLTSESRLNHRWHAGKNKLKVPKA